MNAEISLENNDALKVVLNNIQANDIITLLLDASKIVSLDGNYKMSDVLADTFFTYYVANLGDYNYSGNSGGVMLDASDIDTVLKRKNKYNGLNSKKSG